MILDDDDFEAHAAQMKGEYLRTPMLHRLVGPPACKALIIGSCLANYIIRKDLWCPSDLLLFNGGVLPDISGIIDGYDFVLVQIPLRAIIRDGELWHNRFNRPGDQEDDLHRAQARLRDYLQACLGACKGKPVFVTNFLVPVLNPMGKLLPRYDVRNLAHFVQRLNEDLEGALHQRGAHHTHVLDLDAIANTIGKRFLSDEFFNALNHAAPGEIDQTQDLDVNELAFPRFDPIPAARHHWQLHDAGMFGKMISNEVQAMHHTLTQPTRIKLLVMDLDNTLWRGVLSEEAEAQEGRIPDRVNRAFYNHFGVDDGSLYRLTEGFPYSITEAMHYCKMRGILLAIISKNNHDDTVRNIEKIYNGKLSLDSFVSVKINWHAKADNMRQILQEVNLLPDNVMFVDDNPVERALMDAAFPTMSILGKWIMYVKSTLHHSVLTEVPVITAESDQRTELIRGTLAHRDAYEAVRSGNALAGLAIETSVTEVPADPAHPNVVRGVELINKTNQFNLNGMRLSRESLLDLLRTDCRLFALSVKDKFNDHGVVGFALVNAKGVLVQLAISCRVLGLQVEKPFLHEVMRACGVGRLALYYRATEKNFPLTTWVRSTCQQDGGLFCLTLPDDAESLLVAA